MLRELEKIVRQAGDIILTHYDKYDIDINIKKDGSPVTKADLDSEKYIKSQLENYFRFPIVTEESPVSYEDRKNWTKFWLIDPLDGTEDFIKKNNEFAINIALIENSKPIIGVVFAPALNLLYTSELNKGSKKNGKRIYNNSQRKKIIAAESRQNSTNATKKFLSKNNISKVIRLGSSLKLCALAEGKIDIYPRFNGTKEWDTAAAHIVCNEAGCKVLDIETNKELIYNKESIKNNFFIASRKDLSYL
jgi:3'(2'), 5'-bisphosphate nucleotidase